MPSFSGLIRNTPNLGEDTARYANNFDAIDWSDGGGKDSDIYAKNGFCRCGGRLKLIQDEEPLGSMPPFGHTPVYRCVGCDLTISFENDKDKYDGRGKATLLVSRLPSCTCGSGKWFLSRTEPGLYGKHWRKEYVCSSCGNKCLSEIRRWGKVGIL